MKIVKKNILRPQMTAVIGIVLGALILGLFYPTAQGLATSSSVTGVNESFDYQNPDQFLQTYYNSLRERLGKVWEPKTVSPTLKIDLFGYKLTTTDIIPVTRDENAKLRLYTIDSHTVDAQIITAFGTFYYSRVPIKEVINPENQPSESIRYELYDSAFGFFLELTIYAQYSRVNIAFAVDCGQLTFDGIYAQGYLSSIHPFLSAVGNTQDFDQNSPRGSINVEHLIIALKTQQKDNLVVNNDKLIRELNTAGSQASRSTSNYGVYHEAENFPGTTYFETLPWLWEEHTCISTGILRYYPVTKSQILSDLQYYNMDYDFYEGASIHRDIKAYSIGCHGLWDAGNQHEYWYFNDYFIISDEVVNLWYHQSGPYYSISVYPTNSLVIPDSCFGAYSKSLPPYQQHPDMAHAFTDFGAKVFIGSTVEVSPTDSDPWMTPFWWELCYYDRTVEHAVIDMCNAHGGGWNLGDEWIIIGDSLYKIPN